MRTSASERGEEVDAGGQSRCEGKGCRGSEQVRGKGVQGRV